MITTSSIVPGSVLRAGQRLSTGEYLQSPGKTCFLIMQSDGNLCVYRGADPDRRGDLVWACRTESLPDGDYFAVMQADANLCVYAGQDATPAAFRWGSTQIGYPISDAYHAVLGDEGSLQVRTGRIPDPGTLLWTNTGAEPMNLDQVHELIQRWAPILTLHPNGRYRPSSFPWYARNPGVYLGDPNDRRPVPDPLPSGEASKELYLAFDWNNSAIEPGDMDSAVAYVNARPWDEQGAGGVELQFWYFYPFNGAGEAQIGFTLEVSSFGQDIWDPKKTVDISLRPFGEHQGDWEHLAIYLDPAQQAVRIRASQHDYSTDYYPPGTPGQPTWEERGGRPVFYSALNGHPTYPRSGTYVTGDKSKEVSVDFDIKVFAVDFTGHVALVNRCAEGPELDSAAHYELVASALPAAPVTEPSWLQFLGRCGWVDPPVENPAKQFDEDLTDGLMTVLKPLVPGVLEGLLEDIVEKVVDSVGPEIVGLISEEVENFDGPTMPKRKSSWTD